MGIYASLAFAVLVFVSTHTRARFPELERLGGNLNNYPIGDYLVRIKNASLAGRREVVVENSKFVAAVAKTLIKLKVLESVKVESGFVTSHLAYHRKAPVLIDLKLVSKPGLRHYIDMSKLTGRRRRNASKLILSTPKGVLSSDEAVAKNVGGEVIAEVW